MGELVNGAGLGQRYGTHWVVRDLDLRIEPGITVLLGPNGAGKTTLLETVATLRKPAAGALTVLGLDAADPKQVRRIRARTGFLPQQFGYFRPFTALEFVEYTAWLKRVSPQRIRPVALAALDRVNLGAERDKQMKALSGGMLRRVGIAQAIVHEPELVVLDEPSVGLDPTQRIQLRSLLRGLSADISFLISTHLVDDLRSLADRVLVLSDGRIAFNGSPGELEGLASDDAVGDSALERGYSTVLRDFAGKSGVA